MGALFYESRNVIPVHIHTYLYTSTGRLYAPDFTFKTPPLALSLSLAQDKDPGADTHVCELRLILRRLCLYLHWGPSQTEINAWDKSKLEARFLFD